MSSIWSEIEFIKGLSVKEHIPDEHLILGIGDDCSIFTVGNQQHCLVTTDMLVEGVHFDLSWHPPGKLGSKCIAVNLSDIAAMGGIPQYAFISIAIPDRLNKNWLKEWSDGVVRMLNKYGCKLAGGDTVKGQYLVVNVTIVGVIDENKAVQRNNAKPGQSIFVSGPVGSAAAGLELFLKHREKHFFNDLISETFKDQHLSPKPEIKLGRLLSNSMIVTAMQDVSDGIATDLAHLCSSSGVKAVIDENLIPHHEDLPEISTLIGCSMVDLKISGGEDYRLIFTVEEGKDHELMELLKENGLDRVSRIGEIVEGEGVAMSTSDNANNTVDITFRGFEHRSDPAC